MENFVDKSAQLSVLVSQLTKYKLDLLATQRRMKKGDLIRELLAEATKDVRVD